MRQNTRYYSFFTFISIVFGDFSLKLLKIWIKHRKIIIKSTQRIRFLKFCINNDIISKHLYFLHRHNINLTHYKTHNRYECLNHLHTMRTLRIELNDAFRNMHRSRAKIFHLVRKITQHIPTYINNSKNKNNRFTIFIYMKDRALIKKLVG